MVKNSITKEQKEAVLQRRGHVKLIGWGMGYEAPESDNIIVTVEEVQKWIGTAPEEFWLDQWGECAYDFEQSWENVLEDYEEQDDEPSPLCIDCGHTLTKGYRGKLFCRYDLNLLEDPLN